MSPPRRPSARRTTCSPPPIQLATMCATIANGGVRLQTHFLDKITDYTGETVIEEYQPAELYDAGISSDVLGVVQTGMQMVATQGTAADVFANYPVSIAPARPAPPKPPRRTRTATSPPSPT